MIAAAAESKEHPKLTFEHDSRKCFTEGITTRFSCVTWFQHVNYVLHRNFTDKFHRSPLSLSEDIVRFTPVGFVYKKIVHFHEIFDSVSERFMETGLMRQWQAADHYQERRWQMEWAKSRPEYMLEESASWGVEVDMLTLKNLKGCFYFLFIMCCAGMCCFTAEIIWEWKLRRRFAETQDAMEIQSQDFVQNSRRVSLVNIGFCLPYFETTASHSSACHECI